MADKKKTSPVTLSIAAGLLGGLAFSYVAPSIWSELETSSELTALAIGGAALVIGAITYVLARPKT